MKKFLSRKFLFTLALFTIAQVLKFQCKIGDEWWAMVSIGAVVGYSGMNVWQKGVEWGKKWGK